MLSGSRLVIIHDFEELLTKSSRNATFGRLSRASRVEAKREKDKEIFEHSLDVQLGAPLASNSVYLAYENGRIGVVTVGVSVFLLLAILRRLTPLLLLDQLRFHRNAYYPRRGKRH